MLAAVRLGILRYRRTFVSSKLIWIDGLCIDQKHLDEKAQQVRIIGDVFSNASRVAVWLASQKKLQIVPYWLRPSGQPRAIRGWEHSPRSLVYCLEMITCLYCGNSSVTDGFQGFGWFRRLHYLLKYILCIAQPVWTGSSWKLLRK